MLGLEDAVALVSGASQGIGQAVAGRLLQAGCRVALTDTDHDKAAGAASTLDATGTRCRPYALDVRHPEHCARVVRDVEGAWGPVAVLVNNAGVAGNATLFSGDLAEDIERVMAVNVKGIVHLTQACAPGLMRTRGSVVNVASITTLVATRANVAYGTSKGAVGQLTRFLARDFGPHGVRVNAVAPGLVLTPMTCRIAADADRMHSMVGRTFLGRAAEPDDIAGPVVFLASRLSGYMTGVVMPVDAGYTAN